MSHPQRTTTTITTAASADTLPNPSTASASGDVPMPNKPLHELFRVMSRYQILKTAKSLIVGEACIRHHLNEYRPLERIDILVLTDASPMTLRNILRFDGSKYFSESGALGCAIKMTLPSFLPIICTIETIAPRQLERKTEDYRLQICCQAFRGVHQLQYVPEEGLPFLGLPSIILMEVLLPPEPTVSINASLVWKLAQRLDPNSEWEDWQRNALEKKLTRLVDLGGREERAREQWCEALRLHNDELADGVEDQPADRVEKGPIYLSPNLLFSNLMSWPSWCVGFCVMTLATVLLYFLFFRKTPAPRNTHNTWTEWAFVIVSGLYL
ncbi:hypothetical protein AnigIFM63604_003866 [Aspergillus niger]|nr:hypothetical protein AnigIFM63326_007306 [Aspergillus niger]GLA48378.1 hypothetical protein AnigIFM63604_003866 [Aspergillus niger]